MSFQYKNPIANDSLSAPQGVSLTSNQGTNFSVSQVGGYQEVFYLENLTLTFSGTGVQNLSGNTIPIQIAVQPNSGLTWSTLTLNSDNISSGRRRLGMLVYVHETDTVYQHTIPNYETLWDSLTGLTGSSGITQNSTSTVVNARSQAGRDFISAWTGSTIEGVSGTTRENARWRIFYGSDVTITGGTHSNGTTTLNNSTGGTVTITGYTTSSSDYLSINAVPASISISDFVVSNSMRDAFVTIPSDYHNKTITSVNASYGDVSSSSSTDFILEMRNSSNEVASSVTWTHTGGQRNISYSFPTPLTLTSGNTLNVVYGNTPPQTGSKGYSATFEITL